MGKVFLLVNGIRVIQVSHGVCDCKDQETGPWPNQRARHGLEYGNIYIY